MTAPSRIDWTGAVLLASGLVMLLLTITQASRWGLGSTATWLGFGTAVVLLGTWAWAALRKAEPLLDVRLMLRRTVWTTNVTAFFVGVSQFVAFIMLPRYVQEPDGLGASPLEAGIYLLPMTVGILLAGLVAGRLERRFGARALADRFEWLDGGGVRVAHVRARHAVELYIASALQGVGIGLVDGRAGHDHHHERPRGRDRRGGGRQQCRAHARRRGRRAARGGAARVASGYTAAFAVGLVAMVGAIAVAPLIGGAHSGLVGTAATAAPGRRSF